MTNNNPSLFVYKKQAIHIIAGYESYRNLSTFKEIKQLNDTVRYYKEVLADKLNKTHIAVLDLLRNYSANSKLKTLGVSWRTKNHIAKDLGKSRRTIVRVCNYLEDLGVIRQYNLKRDSDNYQTSNAIVIQPLSIEKEVQKKENVTQEKIENVDTTTIQKKEMSHQKDKFYSLKQNIKTYKERKAVSNSHNHLNFSKVSKEINNQAVQKSDYIPHWIPKKFSKFVSNFYSDSKTIKEFWVIVKQCNRVIDSCTGERAFNKEQEIHIAVTAFKEFISKIKHGVNMRSGIFAYFNGIVNNVMSDFFFDNEFMGDTDFI